jgi:dihydroorotate dehydrogenase
LIGCGGISTGADALEYARAGASLVQIYTGFGYDGAGACRRIKDQLIDELAREDTTWDDIVNKAVGDLSWKAPAPAQNKTVEGTVSQLISEARELQGLLDKLDEKMNNDETACAIPSAASHVAAAAQAIVA